MANDYVYTEDEMNKLRGGLKAYESRLSDYLESASGKKDPNYTKLGDAYIDLETALYNLSIKQLQLAVDDAANAAAAIYAAVSFVTAIVSQDPAAIVSQGGALVSSLKAA